MLSIAASVLRRRPESTVTLLYGNRRSDTVMFADEVADLKDAYPARMQLVHVLSREPQEVELFNGRLDAGEAAARCCRLPSTCRDVDHWWLCGPFGMVTDAHRRAGRARRRRASGSIASCSTSATSRRPRCTTPTPPPGAGAEVTVVLDGRATTVTVPPDMPILDGAQRVRARPAVRLQGRRLRHLPGAGHRAARCAMRRNYALEQAEVDAGYVLTCQALPVTDAVTVDYDS